MMHGLFVLLVVAQQLSLSAAGPDPPNLHELDCAVGDFAFSWATSTGRVPNPTPVRT